jgi:hypothetical protein
MDYMAIYENILQRAWNRNWRSDRWKIGKVPVNHPVEVHHIMPRCIGGTDDVHNLAVLTSKEHYLCHLILARFFKGVPKLKCAVSVMSKDSETKRKMQSEYMKQRHQDPEYRKFMSNAAKKWWSCEKNKKWKSEILKNSMALGKNPRAKKVIDIETNKVYSCIKEASLDLGINYSTLKSYLNGRSKNKTSIRRYHGS